MFNSENSLNHLKEMRQKVILMKGEAVEGIPPLQKDEKNNSQPLIQKHKPKQQEIS